MAGLLKPHAAFELVTQLKGAVGIPIHLHCHATTGMSTATCLKAIEAGVDNVDAAVSSMSMTYGHSATESIVAILQDTDRDTGLDISLLEEIAAYFRVVRKKYARFEGALRGVDSRILVAQVPGGMLTNLENQLREQNATDRLDEVLAEIPSVREDLGFIPLVTPTSQIVGSQAVLNVLTGERYSNISKETAGVLKGEYGATPAPLDAALQQRVLDGEPPVTCRPADLLDPEVDRLTAELRELAKEKNIRLAESEIDDELTYALFPQVGARFLENRDNPDAFEPPPDAEPEGSGGVSSGGTVAAGGPKPATAGPAAYLVTVNGKTFNVEVAESGALGSVVPAGEGEAKGLPEGEGGEAVKAALAGNVFKLLVAVGDRVQSGQAVLVLEAMKMETDISAPRDGTVTAIDVAVGDSVSVGDVLLSIG